MLHELGHVRIWQNLTETTQRQLPAPDGLADVGRVRRHVGAAQDRERCCGDRPGLGEEPQSHLLASRSCGDLAETFELLTGTTPLQPPCPAGE